MGEANVRKDEDGFYRSFKGDGYKKLQGRLTVWIYNVATMGKEQLFAMRDGVKYYFNKAGSLIRLYKKGEQHAL